MSTEAFNTMRKNLVESVTGSALDWLAYMGADAALAAIPDTTPPRYVAAGTLADIVNLLPATEAIHPPLTAPAPLTDELKREHDSFERMFLAACADLGLVNEALGLDPDDGGADPILEAIEELKTKAAAVQFDADELRKLILNVSNTSHWCGAIGGDADDYAVALAKANAADEALFSYVKNLAAPAPQQSGLSDELEKFEAVCPEGYTDAERELLWKGWQLAKAAPAAPVQTSAMEVLQEIVDVADAEPECVTEAMWKRIADAKSVIQGGARPAKQDISEELLTRLEWAVRFIDTYASKAAGPATPEVNKCRAAIAKAKGGAA